MYKCFQTVSTFVAYAATVFAAGPTGPVTYGVLLEFGFGYSEKHKRWRAR